MGSSGVIQRPTATRAEVRRDRKPLPVDVLEVKRCESCGEIMIFTPIVKCSHCGGVLRLRSYSYKRGDKYYAECLTLNLLARGNSEEEAVSRLQEQMFGYVESALNGSSKGLVPRPAPLGSWIRYYIHRARDRGADLFRRHRHSGDLEFAEIGVRISSHC